MSDTSSEGLHEGSLQELEREDVIRVLQARERVLTTLLGSLESFFTVDAQWRCTFANEAGARLAGVRPDDLLGRDVREVVPGELRDDVRAELETAMRERARVAFAAGDRERSAYHVVACPLTDGGLAVYVRSDGGTVESSPSLPARPGLAETRRVEEALRESERRLRIAKEAAALGVYDWEVGSGALTWDERVYAIWGVDRREPVTYETFMAGLHPEDRRPTQTAIDEALAADGGGHYRATFRVVNRADEAVRWVAATGNVLFSEGRPVRLVGTVEDITERRRTEQELREKEKQLIAQRERSSLARDLHDSVTQALFAATMKVEALTLSKEGISDQAARVVEEVRRLNRGALAQMRALLLELRGDPLEDVPIQQLLRQLVEATESRSRVVVRLTVTGAMSLPPLIHVALYRIAQEALNNVARHAAASEAWVVLEMEGERVRLSVGDDGHGFDSSTIGPTRLGIRMMREHAADTGGELTLLSRPGEGAVLTVVWRMD